LELLDEDELELAEAELDELLLEHAETAAMPTTASAAIPLLAEILIVILVSFRMGLSIRSWLACAGRRVSPAR
jgi:hypothetical protein